MSSLCLAILVTDLNDYIYSLPADLIAQAPASPRDAARLFFYDTKADEIIFDTFKNLDRHLPKPSLLVFNDTKVIPARLWLRKETLPARGPVCVGTRTGRRTQAGGGKIEVLLMMNEYRAGDRLIKGIVDRKITRGAKLYFQSGAHLNVAVQEGQFFFFKPSVPIKQLWTLLDTEGHTPIPPYIKKSPLSERSLREKYQSVLAKYPASVAAPTASLHFTPRLLKKIEKQGVERAEVTLHVGAGTFAPIDERNFREKKLFTEFHEVTKRSAEVINRAKRRGVPIISVGTTTMRTLESVAIPPGDASWNWDVGAGGNSTNIFIYPPYEFKIADALVTNFHVPRSSLMLLVDAFLEHKKARRRVLELYDIALREKFRFYSFGDGMLIL